MLSRDKPGLSAPRSRSSIRKDGGRARPRPAERATRRHSFRTVLNGLTSAAGLGLELGRDVFIERDGFRMLRMLTCSHQDAEIETA